tara:strand:- start:155 stop:502 length:348 start_codon:yes stop_codon:yes gene_type:complete
MVNKGVNLVNTNNNVKGNKVKFNFKDKVKNLKGKMGPGLTKAGAKTSRAYGRYLKPSLSLMEKASAGALAVGKLALKHPGKTLITTALGSTVNTAKRIPKRPKGLTFRHDGKWMI